MVGLFVFYLWKQMRDLMVGDSLSNKNREKMFR